MRALGGRRRRPGSMWVALIVAAQIADARSSQGRIDVLTCCVRRFGLHRGGGRSWGVRASAWLASEA